MTVNNSRMCRAIFFVLTICLFSFPAYAKYSGGTGEPNDPYQIATAEDLMLLGDSPEDYDKHFILTADIELIPNLPGCKVFDKAVVAPDLGPDFEIVAFEGTFNGQGHIIRGLTITGSSYLGLFGRLSISAAVLNLGLEDLNVVGEDYVGGLAGSNEGTVINSYSTGLVRGSNYVGGLVGYNYRAVLNSCNDALVRGNGSVGGLAGYNSRAVLNCFNRGTVESTSNVGGLVGGNYGTVSNSYNSGPVAGASVVGGLVGVIYFGVVSNSYSTGSVTGVSYVGGLVGTNGGTVSNTYSTGTVIGTGAYCVGGLVGNNGGTVSKSFWDMLTSGQAVSAGGSGLSTTAMQTITTYLGAGWDMEKAWMICEGQDYPRLRWEGRECP